ncbi:hypothetical protein EV363DRAFT_1369272 [Boletus edulis]|nr:hypothetical protein EV363DRAFT_1369272 [Boletus edulis]
MSSDSTASPSCSRSLSRPPLPPFLCLTTPQGKVCSSNRLGGYKFNIKSLGRTFHHIVFPRESGTGNRLVAGATVEDEDAVCITRTAKLTKRRTTGRHASRPSTTSIVSQLSASHISTSRSPRPFITSFPPLNVSDIPPRSPTNKSPFSAILLSGGDEEREEDNPALALRHTEQVHRARLAKLTRHLGEEIPAELVLSPVFLSRGTSCSSIYSHRGGHHYKHRSLDPSSSLQKSCVAGSTKGSLRRSKSLMERGDSHCPLMLSATGFTPKMPSTEYIASGVRNTETTIHIDNPVPPPCTTAEARYSTSLMNISNGDVLHERVSTNLYPVSSPYTFRPPDETAGPASTHSLSTSRTPPEPAALPRRPATADPSRRVEKLENFFGVAHDDLSVRGTAQTLQCSSANATGDFAIGIHARESQLEVEVKVIKPARFWNSRETAQSIRPGDVIDQLRMMKAS